jgi:nucleoside-diphosphate-sugar epimerase
MRKILVAGSVGFIGFHLSKLLLAEACYILDGGRKTGKCPALWDGRAAERIVQQLRGMV